MSAIGALADIRATAAGPAALRPFPDACGGFGWCEKRAFGWHVRFDRHLPVRDINSDQGRSGKAPPARVGGSWMLSYSEHW